MKKSIEPVPFVAAMPVVIVATKDEGDINFATHGMFGQLNISNPPLVYVSVLKDHKTAKMIKATEKYSINIPSTELLDKIKLCGSASGNSENKSKVFDVFYGQNDIPMIIDCPVNLNCKLFKTIETDDMYIFIAEVIETYAQESCLSQDKIIAKEVDPIICTIQGEFFAIGKEIK